MAPHLVWSRPQLLDSNVSIARLCVFYVKKKWKIVTTRLKLIEVMAPYARVLENLGPADFRPCCGKVCGR